MDRRQWVVAQWEAIDRPDERGLAERLCRFGDRYNETARPFDCRFTSGDLAAMLERLDAHRPQEVPLAA